jgi:hypothetical protein
MARRGVALALVFALASSVAFGPGPAAAQTTPEAPPRPDPIPSGHAEGEGAVGLLLGTRLHFDPDLAAIARSPAFGDPLVDSTPLGVALLAPFAYWSSPGTQYGLELGWARNVHRFRSGRTLIANVFDAVLTARWLPWPERRLWPYFGGSAGWFFSYAIGPRGSKEESAWGIGACLGVGFTTSTNLTLLAELRGMVATQAKAPEGLSVQPGGLFLLVGATWALEPERWPGERP